MNNPAASCGEFIPREIQIEKLKTEKLQIKDKIFAKQNELKLALAKISVELVYDK